MPPADRAFWSAAELIETCVERGWTVGVAESLTGGLVLAELIAVPGASRVVLGGVVAYHESLKRSLLEVPAATLQAHGTVSAECALAMARGARNSLGAMAALSTTGVAGPSKSEGKAPGTVHLAVSALAPGREEVTASRALSLIGARADVRSQACAAGLSLLLDTLTSVGPPAAGRGGGVR